MTPGLAWVALTLDEIAPADSFGAMAPLLEAFLSALPERPEDVPATLGDLLDQTLARARSCWGDVDVPADVFMRRLAGCAAGPELLTTLGALHASDLYLSTGCLAGLPAAVAVLERRYVSEV